jgi:hypothetical protein
MRELGRAASGKRESARGWRDRERSIPSDDLDKSKEKVCKDTGGFGISLQDGVVRCATANAPQVKAANPFNCGFDVTVYYSPGSASGGGAHGSALVYNYDRSVPDQFKPSAPACGSDTIAT